jgi:soluble lytic murein transglycosylase
VLLYQPSVSLQMGIQHLAELLGDYPDLPHVLAAYNAGRSRVERWENRHGVGDDPELFTERIPFRETRDYVRLVIRNMEIYRALYGWEKTVKGQK